MVDRYREVLLYRGVFTYTLCIHYITELLIMGNLVPRAGFRTDKSCHSEPSVLTITLPRLPGAITTHARLCIHVAWSFASGVTTVNYS